MSVHLNTAMQQLYRLLRSNKENGPFSLDQLRTYDIQASDLIWIEGKSTYWQHPSEIEELEQLLDSNRVVVPEPVRQIAPVGEMVSPAQEGRIFIQKPEQFTSDTNSFPHEEPVEIRERFTNPLPLGDAEVPKELKPYNELPLPEATWHYIPKKRKKKRLRVLPFLLLTFFIVLIGFTFFRYDRSPAKAVRSKTAKNQTISIKEESSQKPASEKVIPPGNVAEILANSEVPEVADNVDPVLNSLSHTPRYVNRKIERVPQKTATESLPVYAKKGDRAGNTEAIKSVSALPAPGIQKDTRPLSQVFRLYGLHPAMKKEGVGAFKLSLTNNSDVLRFAAVDVFYKKNGQVAAKETIYFKGVPPHETVTLTAPGNRSADDVSYKLGLVSNEDGSIYYGE